MLYRLVFWTETKYDCVKVPLPSIQEATGSRNPGYIIFAGREEDIALQHAKVYADRYVRKNPFMVVSERDSQFGYREIVCRHRLNDSSLLISVCLTPEKGSIVTYTSKKNHRYEALVTDWPQNPDHRYSPYPTVSLVFRNEIGKAVRKSRVTPAKDGFSELQHYRVSECSSTFGRNPSDDAQNPYQNTPYPA